jgi:hypothetical protein
MELEGAIRALRDRLLIDQDVGLRQLADVLRSELLRAPGLD